VFLFHSVLVPVDSTYHVERKKVGKESRKRRLFYLPSVKEKESPKKFYGF